MESDTVYQRKLICIPTPAFYAFHNGGEAFPKEKFLRISCAYLQKNNSPMSELFVKVMNINIPVRHAILEQCRPLYEYCWFIQKIKDYTRDKLDRDTAVKLAIQDCIKAGIFANFAREHGSEAVNMLFTQFNLEDARRVWHREDVEEGQTLKLIDLILRKLQKGKTPETIADELEEPLQTIQQICITANKCGPEASTLDIYNQLEYK